MMENTLNLQLEFLEKRMWFKMVRLGEVGKKWAPPFSRDVI
jgi:hypothetical protein